MQTWYFQYHTSVTQCNSNDKIYIKAPVIDGSYCHLNSEFLLRIASATVLLLRCTPSAASQTTHCHGYGYYWLWRYKGDCVIVKSHVACSVLWCRPKHSVDVDAPEEMVWGVRGLSVWTMLLETRSITHSSIGWLSWYWLATEHGLSSFESTILPPFLLVCQTSDSREILRC